MAARPKDAAARNALGGLYLRLGKLPEAEAELSEAAKLDPKSPWAATTLDSCATSAAIVRAPSRNFAARYRSTRRSLPHEPSSAKLSKNRLHHVAGDVGQPEIAAAVAVGEPRVIEAQQVQHRRVQIVHVHRVLHGFEAEFVGGAVRHAALDAAAGQQHAEAVAVVIAAVLHLHQAADFRPPACVRTRRR